MQQTVGSLVCRPVRLVICPLLIALQISTVGSIAVCMQACSGMPTSLGGLVISYELGLKPGGTIVLLRDLLSFW